MSEVSVPPMLVKERFVDAELLMKTNFALLMFFFGFVGYLILPRGTRKYLCNAYPKRFHRISFAKHEVPTQITTSPNPDYEPIDDCYTSFTPRSSSRSDRPNRGWMPPTPLILEPGNACVTTGQIFAGQPAIDAASSIYSSPSRLFTPGRTSRKTRNARTPFQPTIDETDANSQSPNSVLDQSMGESKKLLVLMSSRCLDKQQMQNQQEAFALLRQRKVPFETVDGMNGLQRSRREELYQISGVRAQYPQFFFVHANGITTYFGDYKTLHNLHHAEGLPRSYRDANPDVSTWNEIFCDTSQIFSV